jgi:8-oxo-dGTP diphosphatase
MTVPTANRACAAVLRGSSILMVHHHRDGRDYWTLPGGGVEAGESPSQAAVRELAEETGLTGTVLALLYRRDYRSRDGAQVTEHCYLVAVPACDEPVLGSDPELDDKSSVLVGVSWLPAADLRTDRQVRRVLDAVPESSKRR